MKNRIYIILGTILLFFTTSISAKDRWNIEADGSIIWKIDKQVPHFDAIEMSGLKVSTVLRYGVQVDSSFFCERSMVWPMLRRIPNNTHASLMRRFGWNILEMITVNGTAVNNEKVNQIKLNGIATVESTIELTKKGKIELIRYLFPSTDKPAFCEKYVLKNTGKTGLKIEIPSAESVIQTNPGEGTEGSYRLVSSIQGSEAKTLKPGEEISFSAFFAGYKQNEPKIDFNIDAELQARQSLIKELWGSLILETPDPIINTMFAFAKIRGAESIYATKGGLMHGPGGETFYAAIWANDQAEYINPFFPFQGYDIGNESAMNSFRHFARFMNPEYKPIPSSIIAEGDDIWNGAGDRGDAAMIAYGAARYALARGSMDEAENLWPLIEWCLEYCRRNLNKEGVVASDSDELENRFPSGDANLCTSTLYYDALISAADLGKELKKSSSALTSYRKQAKTLRENIEKYFGANVEGFDTYQYYKGNDILRSWICMPLTVGIYDRKDATIDALFSPRLWTDNGLLTQAGTKTFWDRSTLYALRGVFACGETEKGLEYLEKFSQKRLLGDHVPYAIEAWPEGNQRHLSAESGLYARIITEGMFGIRPTGLKSFTLTPRLPVEWQNMSLRKVKAFGSDFDIQIFRNDNRLNVSISQNGKNIMDKTIKEGESVNVIFKR